LIFKKGELIWINAPTFALMQTSLEPSEHWRQCQGVCAMNEAEIAEIENAMSERAKSKRWTDDGRTPTMM